MALEMKRRLQVRTDLFQDVQVPRSDPFFERNGLLYQDLDDLEELTERLAEVQPFIGTLRRDQQDRCVVATGQPTVGAAHELPTLDVKGLRFFERFPVQANRFNDFVVGWHK